MTVRIYTKEYGCICTHLYVAKIAYEKGKLYLIYENGYVYIWLRILYDYFTVEWRGNEREEI